MRWTCYWLWALVHISFSLTAQQVSSQSDKKTGRITSIDPSRYVIIYEKKNNNQNELLWCMRKDTITVPLFDRSGKKINEYAMPGFIPYQKWKVLSTTSEIEIMFDIDSLSKNIEIYGSISLAARSGDRKIEIVPYYQIGESQNSYGVDSRPIKEIADYFLRLVTVADSSKIKYQEYNKLFNDLINDDLVLEVKDVIQSAISSLAGRKDDELVNSPSFRQDEISISKIATLLSDKHPNKSKLQNSTYRTVGELRTLLNEARQNTNFTTVSAEGLFNPYYYSRELPEKQGDIEKREHSITRLTKLYEEYFNEISNLQMLLSSIAKSDDNTIKAFLNFTLLTITDFREMVKTLGTLTKTIKKYPTLDSYIRSNEPDNLAYALRGVNIIVNRFRDSGDLRSLLKYLPENTLSDTLYQKALTGKRTYIDLLNNREAYKALRDILAEEAGRMIFSNLVRGKIDIKKSKIQDNEELEIFLIWNKSPKEVDSLRVKDLPAVNLSMPLAKFLIKKVGWHLDIAESALLIHRIDEEKLGTDYPISPSNFKPTAGASMLWSYYNTFRVKDNSRLKGLVRTIHWLEPSFGINVSYLDFRTDRDVEFGAGPVIGLFQNRIFFVGGYNFSVTGESPFYMGIGFSFLNIFQRIKDNEGK
ncbi:MAG: hypothetical protein C0490_00325 [Marivirga sp.]|nr:hypothetical protein [Marivirga sp.]